MLRRLGGGNISHVRVHRQKGKAGKDQTGVSTRQGPSVDLTTEQLESTPAMGTDQVEITGTRGLHRQA